MFAGGRVGGNDGYTVVVQEMHSAAETLRGYASDCQIGKSDLDGNTLPAPATGEGIGAAAKTFIAQWQDLFGKLDTEFAGMADRTQAAAEVYVKVEHTNRTGFAQFSR